MTPTVEPRPATSAELERVVDWRRFQLERGGYPPEAAAAVAAKLEIDLYRAIALVHGGCPPGTAVRILL